jgi:predicted PurR-regulated permease PerM
VGLIVAVALGVAVGMLAVSLFWTLMRGVYSIQSVLWPIAMALLLAYIFDPLVSWMTRRLRVARWASTGLLFLIGYTVLVLALLWLVPLLIGQVTNFARQVPQLATDGYQWLDRHVDIERVLSEKQDEPSADTPQAETVPDDEGATTRPHRRHRHPRERAIDQITGVVRRHGTQIGQVLIEATNAASRGIGTVLYVMSLLVLMPVYTFFFLWHFDRVRAGLAGWVPNAHRARVYFIAGRMDAAVANFFRGQLVICLVVGTLTAVGWSVVGLRFGLLLGLLVGVLNLVPFMGQLVGLPIACVVALLTADSPVLQLVGVLSVFVVVQGLDSLVLTPTIQNKAVGLHPVTIIVVLLIGSGLLGILGMLLAVPVAAAVKVLWEEWGGPKLRNWLHADRPPDPPPDQQDEPSPDASTPDDKDASEKTESDEQEQPPKAEAKEPPRPRRKGRRRKGGQGGGK